MADAEDTEKPAAERKPYVIKLKKKTASGHFYADVGRLYLGEMGTMFLNHSSEEYVVFPDDGGKKDRKDTKGGGEAKRGSKGE